MRFLKQELYCKSLKNNSTETIFLFVYTVPLDYRVGGCDQCSEMVNWFFSTNMCQKMHWIGSELQRFKFVIFQSQHPVNFRLQGMKPCNHRLIFQKTCVCNIIQFLPPKLSHHYSFSKYGYSFHLLLNIFTY